LKSGIGETLSGVRIPPSPPNLRAELFIIEQGEHGLLNRFANIKEKILRFMR
jgi:hypothetical protein